MSKNIAKHNFKSFDADIRAANKACKENPDDEKLQDRRRALLTLRRGVNGEELVTDDELVEIAKVSSAAERLKAETYEKLNMEDRAIGAGQLADDIDIVVLEIVTVESTDNAETV